MKRFRTGFTLIELLIAIMLLMIVMLMISRMFSSAQDIYRTAAKRASVFSQGRIALDVIETDLARINNNTGTADLVAASRFVPNGFNRDDFQRLQSSLPFERQPDPTTTETIKPVLAFQTQTSWQMANGDFQSGKAQVIYYLRKRPNIQGLGGQDVPASTAYLMRRVIPLGSEVDYELMLTVDGDIGGSAVGYTELPLEEEVASSVLEFRVWAYNNGAAAYMAQQANEGNVTANNLYGLLRTDSPSSLTALLRDTVGGQQQNQNQNPNQQNPNQPQVVNILDPRGGETFSWGGTAGGQSILQPNGTATYVVSRGQYPLALGIEITFADDDAEVTDDGHVYGTVRTIRRVISLPGAEPTSTLPPGDNGVSRFKKAVAGEYQGN